MISETFEEQRVTYTLQKEDRFYVVENVPARVSTLTGEQLFSPETVKRLQKIINGQMETPVRFLETPVFKFGLLNTAVKKPMIWDIWWAEQKLRGSENVEVLRRSVEFLGQSPNRKQAVALLMLAHGWLENRFKDNFETVRQALVAQGNADPSVIVSALQNLPDSISPYSDEVTRRLLLRALAQINKPEAFQALLQATQNKGHTTRRDAMIALRQRNDKQAAQFVVPLLEDSDREVRAQAVATLGELGDASVIGPLRLRLEDWDVTVRRFASDALRKLGWSPQNEHERAVVAVADRVFAQVVALGADAALPVTLLLHHGYEEEQDFAFRALREIGDVRVLPDLVKSAREKPLMAQRSLDLIIAILKHDGQKATPDILTQLASLSDIEGGEDMGQNDGRIYRFRLDTKPVQNAARAEINRRENRPSG